MSGPESPPDWPLPVGHRFGPGDNDLRTHTGRTSIQDSQALRLWQSVYRHRVRRSDFGFGYYCGETQRAAAHVQRLCGFPVTGYIDEDTWRAVWVVRPPTFEPPAKQPKPPPKAQQRAKDRKVKDYWRRVSNRVSFVTDGSQPPWWPGRPFGPGESGAHVEGLQRLLGARETGRYTKELGARVRAVRRLHGLPVSDLVSLDLAVILDPGPWA